MIKFNVLTADKISKKDGGVCYKVIGTLEGDEIKNGSQVFTTFSNNPVVPKQDYNVKISSSFDMKFLRLEIDTPIFKK